MNPGRLRTARPRRVQSRERRLVVEQFGGVEHRAAGHASRAEGGLPGVLVELGVRGGEVKVLGGDGHAAVGGLDVESRARRGAVVLLLLVVLARAQSSSGTVIIVITMF